MNSFLKYEWRPHDGGVQIAVTFEGSILDLLKATGMMIQHLYGNLKEEDKSFFRFMCKQMMDDDAPTWRPERNNAVTVDLKALKKTLEAQQDGTD